MSLKSNFWTIFGAATALKVILIPSYHSTDFEVHRNWLAITHSLPLNRWYYDTTSQWTLDYPPLFAYLEWLLSQIAYYVDPKMLQLENHNYCSTATKQFQRMTVIVLDIIYALGVLRCLKVLRISKDSHAHFAAEILFLLNIGLIFVDHIHFQYNGFMYGILLLSISFLLEERYLWSAFTFSMLLNFKHIFLYMAPAFAVYYLKFYCLSTAKTFVARLFKLAVVGLIPFLISFGPFWQQLPQVFSRLFPFKRGLTHAYWAPNVWAIYNTMDKGVTYVLGIPQTGPSTTSGLIQEFERVVLPKITPTLTFILTALFMLPVLVKLLLYTKKSESRTIFLRTVILCSLTSFMFGWHVHEKAILMCLIPLCLLSVLDFKDAEYSVMFSIVSYFSLFPLLFHVDLLFIRYSLYVGYVSFMLSQYMRIHNFQPDVNILEIFYICGFILLPMYEHLSPFFDIHKKLPFLPLLLTSLYCGIGLCCLYFKYYMYTLTGKRGIKIELDPIYKQKPKETTTKAQKEKSN